MSEELKPCPMCGCPAEMDTLRGYRRMHDGSICNAIAVYCTQCSLDISVCIDDVPDIKPAQVAAMWNRRAQPPTDAGQALENCRLFAARHHKEEWSATILRFCAEGGAVGSPLRATQPLAQVADSWAIDHPGLAQAMAAQPVAQAEPLAQDRSHAGPEWSVSQDGRRIDSDHFHFDAILKLDGDFADDEQRKQYADSLAAKLNAAQPPAEPVHEVLRLFVGASYPVDKRINKRGHNWCEAYLDQALVAARALVGTAASAIARTDGMPTSADERYLRRLLATRCGMAHSYHDDGEAHGDERGISIDFMREPIADIDVKLRALNVARFERIAPSVSPEPTPAAEPVTCQVLLRRLEWSGFAYNRHGDGKNLCPDCEAWKDEGHKPDCELMALLAAHPPRPEPLTDAERIAIVQSVVRDSSRPIGVVEFGRLVAVAIEAAIRGRGEG